MREDDGINSPVLGAIRRLSAVDTVCARIAMAVNVGLIGPGERLPAIDEIAAAFGVSPATVNRGLAALQRDGLVERRSGRFGGTFVASDHASAQQQLPIEAYQQASTRVHELIDTRAVLEAGFASLAVDACTPHDLAEFDRLIEVMSTTESWAEFRNADRSFHLRLAQSADLPNGMPTYEAIDAELSAYFLPYPMQYLRGSNDEHQRIRSAIADGDRGAAAKLAAEHVLELHRSMFVGFAPEALLHRGES